MRKCTLEPIIRSAEDWDNLVVLDACRFDTFKEINWIPGRLEKRISAGSSTLDWIEKNFDDYYPDTVVVGANPRMSAIKLKEILGIIPFYRFKNVWDGAGMKSL